MAERLARPRSTPRRRATSRSASAILEAAAVRLRAGARRHASCGRTGTARRCSCRPTKAGLAPTLCCMIACDARGGGARRGGAPSRARLHARAMAARYAELYGELVGARRMTSDRGRLARMLAGSKRSATDADRFSPPPEYRRTQPGLVMPKLVLFCHSLRSDWNHGNAHFLRGMLAECRRAAGGGGLGAGGRVERAQSCGRARRDGARRLARGLSRLARHGLRPGVPRHRTSARRRGSGAVARMEHAGAGGANRQTTGPAGATCCCSTTPITGWRPNPKRSPAYRPRWVRRRARVWRGAGRGLSPPLLGPAGIHMA